MELMRDQMIRCLKDAQEMIYKQISQIDEKEGRLLPWETTERNTGGMGCTFRGGSVIESGCANLTITSKAPILKEMASLLPEEYRQNFSKYTFFTAGLSVIFHPISPLIPSLHANYRYFEIEDDSDHVLTWYFGGGSDLAPSYLFVDDVIHFHSILKEACDRVDVHFYKELKKNADEYFYLPHRKEHRGIGGTFAYRLSDRPQEILFNWIQDSCKTILTSYLPIIEKRKQIPFSEEQKKWQLIRRGRYAEFILLCDVGVRFGLTSGIANVDNIFMAMPPLASWDNTFTPKPNSPEEAMMEVIKKPRDWC